MGTKIPTFFILRPSKIYLNWEFWFEKNTIWQPCPDGYNSPILVTLPLKRNMEGERRRGLKAITLFTPCV
jgi:hypothetical protein